MAKSMDLPAGARTRILHLFSDSVPKTIRFTAEGTDGAPPTGTVEIVRTGRATVARPLGAENAVEKGFTDWNYSLYVTPDRDCRVTFQGRHVESWWIIAAIVILALISGGMAALFADMPPLPEG